MKKKEQVHKKSVMLMKKVGSGTKKTETVKMDQVKTHSQNEVIEHRTTKNLIVKPGQKWFEQCSNDSCSQSSFSSNVISSLKAEAEMHFKEDVQHYKKFLERRKDKSDFSWMQKILHTGTMSDRISAHILLIQDSAVHNISSIESLIGMVNTKGKRECLMAMDSLCNLFLSDLLLKKKKLASFNQHPLDKLDELSSGNIIARKKRLILWHFEDRLKDLYATFIKNVQLVSHDTVEKTKQKAVSVMYELLKNNPEQEQFLLEHLVNKIGDPLAKVGSHVCYMLGQLVNFRRAMVAVVIQEVERLLFRPNVADRAKYYCLCFLNQLILNRNQSDIANKLINIYFGQFKLCIKKGEVNTKMMSALLSGVARAYPYAQLKNDIIMQQLDSMYKLVYVVSFNISIQALMLIFQVLDSKESVSDRFYCALYRKLLDPELSTSSRHSMLLNLLYRALKKDVSSVRVKAFVKRLLQVTLYQAPTLQCGILLLISELLKTHSDLNESKAFCYSSDSDDEEHYEDVPDDDDDNASPLTSTKNSETKSPPPPKQAEYSWVHRLNNNMSNKKTGYDSQNRNPLYAGAEYCNLWELQYLKRSYHPSVSLFANHILRSKNIQYSGDPLQDFSIIRFLDRFVYRNPKKLNEAAKPDAHQKVFHGKKSKLPSEFHQLPITSSAYIQQNEGNIPVEERFIYRYLRQRASDPKRINKDDSDVESVNSDEFELLLNQIHPEDEGKDALDFAKELDIHKQKAKNKKSRSEVKDDSRDDDDDDLNSLQSESDFEDQLNFDDDNEFQEAFDDIDEELELNKSDDLITKSGKQKNETKKGLKSKSIYNDNLFASADQFATLIEDNSDLKVDTISSEAFINTDKAAVKQLAWEKERDRYVKGTDWRSRKFKGVKRKFKDKPQIFKKKKKMM